MIPSIRSSCSVMACNCRFRPVIRTTTDPPLMSKMCIRDRAYMRGRTLDDSFIILDEAQNTSREQMKMFLTRMGFGSKVVITGDITQIDLPTDKISGLKEAMKVLRDVEGVGICQLTQEDVVRHVMVQRIIEAYARYEDRRKK